MAARDSWARLLCEGFKDIVDEFRRKLRNFKGIGGETITSGHFPNCGKVEVYKWVKERSPIYPIGPIVRHPSLKLQFQFNPAVEVAAGVAAGGSEEVVVSVAVEVHLAGGGAALEEVLVAGAGPA